MKKITILLLTSILFLACSTELDVPEAAIIADNTILTYTDVEFSQTASSTIYGRFFSTKTGKIIKNIEVNTINGADIDIAYVGGPNSFIYFTSPDDVSQNYNIPNATKSSFKNYNSGFTVADFDNMTNDSKLKNLEVINDNDAIGTFNFPVIVTFKNAKGKKGVIKLKAYNSSRLLVDIKVQK